MKKISKLAHGATSYMVSLVEHLLRAIVDIVAMCGLTAMFVLQVIYLPIHIGIITVEHLREASNKKK